jgi:hypothetical protein
VTQANGDRAIGLNTEVISLANLLSEDRIFRVPFLQRPFQWGTEQVGDMIGDLVAAFEGGYDYYFLGHIIGAELGDSWIEVVDGQQRLTTFTILLACLRDRFAAVYPDLAAQLQGHIMLAPQARFHLRPADASFLLEHVQTPGGTTVITADYSARPAPFAAGTDAQNLIVSAAKQINAQLGRFAEATLRNFAEFLSTRALIGFMRANNRTGAAMIIRGMNMRGRHMSPADLTKLEAIGNSGLSPEQQEKAARVWEEQEDALGAEDFAFLLEILPLLASRQTTKRPGDLVEWRKHAFANVDAATLLTDLLPHYAAIFRELMLGEVLPDDEEDDALASRKALADVNRRLKGLLFLQERHWVAPAIAAVAANRARAKFLSSFFQGLERLSFACFLDAVRHESRPERFAAIVRSGADETLLSHAFALKQAEVERMWSRLLEPFARHNWRRRAIAFRANAALPGGSAFDANADVTVEHILPAAFNNEWAALGWKPRAAVQCSDLLGNFAVLTGVQNRHASGKGFAAKREIFFGWKDAPVHALTAHVRAYEDWNEEAVRHRTKALADALFIDWGIYG